MKTLLVASVIRVAITGCDSRSSRATSTTSYDDWEAEYRKRSDAQLEECARQIRRAAMLQDSEAEQSERSDALNERYSKLLDRLERQADRQDAILDAQEKQLGIKRP